MWNCATCGAEVNDGLHSCWHCGATAGPLTQTAPETPAEASEATESLVSVATAPRAEHAHVMRCHLEAAGIPVFIKGEPATGMNWAEAPATEVIQLQVRDGDHDRARALLAEIPADEAPSVTIDAAPVTAAETVPVPVAEEMTTPLDTVTETAPAEPSPVWEPANRDALTPYEYTRSLESHLSSLMDDHDVADWKVNPAFHPDVHAFIQGHANNAGFLKKAEALQQNRAKYFATMRAQAEKKAALAPAPTPAPVVETPVAPEAVPPATAAKTKPRKRWYRSPTRWLTLLLLFTLVGAVGGAYVWQIVAERRLQAALDRAVELDGVWTWDDMQEQRAEIPDGQNAALQLEIALNLLPPDWSGDDGIARDARDLAPATALTDEQRARVFKELHRLTKALAEARGLAPLSTGRFPPRPQEEWLTGQRSDATTRAAIAAKLLTLDAILQAHDKNLGQALASTRAALVAGRSVGDDPDSSQQAQRLACQRLACQTLERVLAQGEADDPSLAAAQKLFADESMQPAAVHYQRGYRAWVKAVREAKQEAPAEAEEGDDEEAWKLPPTLQRLVPYADDARQWLARGWHLENEALETETLTAAVEVAKLPLDEQPAALEELVDRTNRLRSESWPQWRYLKGLMAVGPAIQVAQGFQASQTRLRCAATALAAERYRLVNGHWPHSFEEMAEFLPEVPLDPYDGQPLRMRKTDDGLVIYSIGRDKIDDNGIFDAKGTNRPGTDIVMRLWDVDKRRQGKK